ncbi:MAG: hypothetical protein KAI47_18800 [Deltaproteobacteria bacterium]|nr:hypothetical protein [Deltaproteobacteria bacterium]
MLVDDAYISARYADNLVKGYGLVFNHDERVEGYSNFLFIVLMSISQVIGISHEAWAKILGVASGVGLIVALFVLSRRLIGSAAALLLVFAVALDPRFGIMAVWGMETLFYLMLYTLAWAFLTTGRWKLSAVFLALASMTRMEATMLFAVAFIYVGLLSWSASREAKGIKARFWRAVSGLGPFVLIYASLFGTYFLVRWNYYGYLLPNTFYAKIGHPLDAYMRGLEYLKTSLDNMGIWWLSIAAWVFGLVASLATLVLLILGRIERSRCKNVSEKVLIVLGLVVYGIYVVSVGGDCFGERFVYHLLPFLLVSVLLLLSFPVELLGCCRWRWISEASRWIDVGRSVVVVSVALVIAVGLIGSKSTFGTSDAVAGWASLGRYLKRIARPDSVLATCAAGAIPYYSGLRTLDMLGLNDVHIAHMTVPNMGKGFPGHEKGDPKYILSKRPDYISTWIDSQGRPGRGLRFIEDFYTHYELSALLRMDGASVSEERVFEVPRTIRDSDIENLVKGKGSRPGLHTWALWKRTGYPQKRRAFDAKTFFTRLTDKSVLGRDGNVLKVARGHSAVDVLFGPYVSLNPGRYVLEMPIRWANYDKKSGDLCNLEVYDGLSVVAGKRLTKNRAIMGEERVIRDFFVDVKARDRKYEFRLFCWGNADVIVKSMNLTAIALGKGSRPRP